jgi:ferredoxin
MTNPYQTLTSSILNQAGLNCHAVFRLADLPEVMRNSLRDANPDYLHYRQLILIGHGGKDFWAALTTQSTTQTVQQTQQLTRQDEQHPVDDFTVSKVNAFMQTEHPQADYTLLYPGAYLLNLQELGQLAGWHHASPFMVGINACFGSWFAYRAAILANTDLPVTAQHQSAPPCQRCEEKICIRICPAAALTVDSYDLQKCLHYRQQENSLCEVNCIARWSCPEAPEHRYTKEQMQYHYGCSIRMIKHIA